MAEKYNYVIYHKNCLDGFTGFFILTLTDTINENAIIYPDVPSSSNIPPNIDNKNVIIIDVAYKKEVLSEIFKRAKQALFIDHHISIRDDVLRMDVSYPNKIIYNEYNSASVLVWKHFFGKKTSKIPQFVRYIQDNDIGTWELKYTFPFISALNVNYSTQPTKENLEHWNKLFDKKEINRLVKKGLVYQEYSDYLVDQNIKKYSLEAFPSEKIFNDFPGFFGKTGQYKVVVYNGNGCPATAQLSTKFLDKIDCDFVILWVQNLDRKQYVLQFRSKNVDVANIAKLFGGGGHTLASACSISTDKYNIADLFTEESLPRSYV